jgi:hypothetical protein
MHIKSSLGGRSGATAPSSSVCAATGRTWIDQLADGLVASRPRRVICLMAGVWLLNAFDLAMTVLAHQQGLLHEQNPLARAFLDEGPASVALFKFGLVLVGSLPLLRFRAAPIAELGVLTVLLAYAVLALHWSACYETYSLVLTNDVHLSSLQALTAWP